MTTTREYFDILSKCMNISLESLYAVFSLNFSSAGKGPFTAGKPK